MSDNRLDSIIRDTYKMLPETEPKASSSCPPDERLAHYITCVLAEEPAEQGLLSHITECDLCFSKTASAVSALTSFKQGRPSKQDSIAMNKAKSIPKLYPREKKSKMKRHRYLFAAGGFFILSFIVKAYFLQFLVAAVVFGLKWVMDTGGSKALIMIYDAWQYRKGARDEEAKRGSLTTRPRL